MDKVMEKHIQVKQMKGLLDLIILEFLNAQPMHGYAIISKIRRVFGVYFGPSTIYPLLSMMEKRGYVKSKWNMNSARPVKLYEITGAGRALLSFSEDLFKLIARKIGAATVVMETPTLVASSE